MPRFGGVESVHRGNDPLTNPRTETMTKSETTGTILDSYEDETGQELAALAEKHPVEGAALAEVLLKHTFNGYVRCGAVSEQAIDDAEHALREAGR